MSKFLSVTGAGLICAATMSTALAAGAAHGRIMTRSKNIGYDRSTRIEHVSRRTLEATTWAHRAKVRHNVGTKGTNTFWTPPMSSSASMDSSMSSSMSSSAAAQ